MITQQMPLLCECEDCAYDRKRAAAVTLIEWAIGFAVASGAVYLCVRVAAQLS